MRLRITDNVKIGTMMVLTLASIASAATATDNYLTTMEAQTKTQDIAMEVLIDAVSADNKSTNNRTITKETPKEGRRAADLYNKRNPNSEITVEQTETDGCYTIKATHKNGYTYERFDDICGGEKTNIKD